MQEETFTKHKLMTNSVDRYICIIISRDIKDVDKNNLNKVKVPIIHNRYTRGATQIRIMVSKSESFELFKVCLIAGRLLALASLTLSIQ